MVDISLLAHIRFLDRNERHLDIVSPLSTGFIAPYPGSLTMVLIPGNREANTNMAIVSTVQYREIEVHRCV